MRLPIRIFACLLMFGCGIFAQVRIASLNLDKRYGPGLLAQVRDTPDLRKADILLLREVVHGPASHVPAEIAAALGLHAVFAPAFQLNERFHEGLAILSRYPLSEPTVIPLSRNQLNFNTRVRIAFVAMVQLPGGPVRVVNIHLDNRVNEVEKREQIEELWPGAVPLRTVYYRRRF